MSLTLIKPEENDMFMKSTIILSMKYENLIQRSIMLIKKINVISSRAFEILLQLYSVIDSYSN